MSSVRMTEQTAIERVVEEFIEWRNSDPNFGLEERDNRPRVYTTDDDERFVLLDERNDVSELLDYFVRASKKATLVLECFGQGVRFDMTGDEPQNATIVAVQVVIALTGSQIASGACYAGVQRVSVVEPGVGEGAFANIIEARLIQHGRIASEKSKQAVIEWYLSEQMCDSIEEWAIDNGYRYNKHVDGWYNDEGQSVDLEQQLIDAIQSEDN